QNPKRFRRYQGDIKLAGRDVARAIDGAAEREQTEIDIVVLEPAFLLRHGKLSDGDAICVRAPAETDPVLGTRLSGQEACCDAACQHRKHHSVQHRFSPLKSGSRAGPVRITTPPATAFAARRRWLRRSRSAQEHLHPGAPNRSTFFEAKRRADSTK